MNVCLCVSLNMNVCVCMWVGMHAGCVCMMGVWVCMHAGYVCICVGGCVNDLESQAVCTRGYYYSISHFIAYIYIYTQ